MAEVGSDNGSAESGASSWRALWTSAGALVATLALIVLILSITWSNRARDEAIGWERRSAEITLLTRTIDATIARSEAALGRYVLDEQRHTGPAYYSEWRTAGWQIRQLERMTQSDADQLARTRQLRALYERRGAELSPAAS